MKIASLFTDFTARSRCALLHLVPMLKTLDGTACAPPGDGLPSARRPFLATLSAVSVHGTYVTCWRINYLGWWDSANKAVLILIYSCLFGMLLFCCHF